MMVPQSREVETLDVLFIEDDADLAEMYRLKLELDGYWVEVAAPEAAVAMARARPPDMVFIDLSSGSPQRLRVLEQVRKVIRRPSLPAIVLSSLRAEQLQERGARLTACDYLITGQVPDSIPPDLTTRVDWQTDAIDNRRASGRGNSSTSSLSGITDTVFSRAWGRDHP